MDFSKSFAAITAVVFSVLTSFLNAQTLPESSADLQALIDAAATSKSKKLELPRGRYEISKSIKLSQKHSGLVITSKSGNAKDVVVSAGRRIRGWQRGENGIWHAKIVGEDEVSFITVNGKRAYTATNGDYLFAIPECGNKVSNSFDARNCDIKEILALSPQEREQVIIDIYVAWSFFRVCIDKIEKISDDISRVTFKGPKLNMRHGYYPRYILRNYKNALKNAGDFVFDKNSNTVFYIPREGENMESAEVFYPYLDSVLIAEGEVENPISNLTISGITFGDGARRKIPEGSDGAGSWGKHSQGDNAAKGFITFNFVKNLTLKNCVIKDCDMYALCLERGVWDTLVCDNQIHSVNGGIRIGAKERELRRRPDNKSAEELDGISTGRVKISNNIIYNYGLWAKSAIGVMVYDCHHVEISHNEIFDGYYSAISCGFTFAYGKNNTHHNKINYNRISHLAYGHTSDLGGIYTLGVQQDSEIVGNSISDIDCHLYGGWGIYNDEGSSFWKIRGNYTAGTSNGGYNMHYGQNIVVENNLFTFDKVAAIGFQKQAEKSLEFSKNIVVYKEPATLFRNSPPKPSAGKFSKNIYWCENGEVKFGNMNFAQWKASGQGDGSLIEKPDIEALLKGASVPKIGFAPLEARKAGTFGAMRKRADGILQNYKFAQVVKKPRKPDFEYGVIEDFSREKPASKTKIISISPADTDSALVKDSNKLAFKFAPAKKGDARAVMKVNIFQDGEVLANFDVKLNSKTSFKFDLRNDSKSSRTSTLEIDNAAVKTKFGKIALPTDKWLRIQTSTKLDSAVPTKEYCLKILDMGGNILFDDTLPIKGGKGFSGADRLQITIPSDSNPAMFTNFYVVKKPKKIEK